MWSRRQEFSPCQECVGRVKSLRRLNRGSRRPLNDGGVGPARGLCIHTCIHRNHIVWNVTRRPSAPRKWEVFGIRISGTNLDGSTCPEFAFGSYDPCSLRLVRLLRGWCFQCVIYRLCCLRNWGCKLWGLIYLTRYKTACCNRWFGPH